VLVASAAALFAVEPSLAAVLREYNDPRDGTPTCANAPDVTTVHVDDAHPGDFSIRVHTPNCAGFEAGDEVTVFLNVDRNRGNNDGGAEYAVSFLWPQGASAASCGVFRWNGATYQSVRSMSCPWDYGPTLTFPRADVGNPADFEFWIRSTWTSTGGTVHTDRAPDSDWWLYDPTPPDTAIASGPPASTADTSASFTFSASEAATFQCSLDGSAFASCGSPAGYTNLRLGGHTFQVQAIDSQGNVDPSAASYTWTVVDNARPTAQATTGECCNGGRARVEYTVADNSGSADATVVIYRVGRSTPVSSCTFRAPNLPNAFSAHCAVPLNARGWLRFCVSAKDAAGNSSSSSCGPVAFPVALNADVRVRSVVRGRSLKVVAFRLSNLAGGKASIRCRGCRLRRGRPVGTVLRPGARIEVRVVKPRVRGSFLRLRNVGGSLKKSRACLPPGLSGPVVSCSKAS
jgi:hypothetical protein